MMKTIIYYDGACHLCSREIEHYRKIDKADALEFVDIADPGFDASAHGLDPIRVNQEMHVRDSKGKLHIAVQAFIEIWKVIPLYQKWVRVAENPLALPFLKVGYSAFAKVRPYLPKRKTCYSGVCSPPPAK
jgi:predicted DCC family thiol-disulfide oxidoreductase YuxK